MSSNKETPQEDHRWLRHQRDLAGVLDLEDDVCVALFGLGRIGTVHVDNLCKMPHVRILYCVESFPERSAFAKRRWRLSDTNFIQPSEKDKVFQDERVEAIIICTPTYEHEELVLRGLEAGKAVFCEKPVSLSLKGIEKCIEAAKKSGKPLMIGFNRRFDPTWRSLKKRVDAGQVGKVQIIKFCSRDCPRSPTEYFKTSGGYFHDSAVHDIDMMCWMLGEYPESVSAYAHTFLEDLKAIGEHDTVVITMKFPSGTIAVVDLSRIAVYGHDQRMEVFGSKGMLTGGELKPIGLTSYDERGATDSPICYAYASRYQEAYCLEMENFLKVVKGKESLEMNPEAILAVSKIATACHEVVNTGKSATLNWK